MLSQKSALSSSFELLHIQLSAALSSGHWGQKHGTLHVLQPRNKEEKLHDRLTLLRWKQRNSANRGYFHFQGTEGICWREDVTSKSYSNLTSQFALSVMESSSVPGWKESRGSRKPQAAFNLWWESLSVNTKISVNTCHGIQECSVLHFLKKAYRD